MIEMIVGIGFFLMGLYLMFFAIKEIIFERKKKFKITDFEIVIFLKASLLLVLGLVLIFRIDKML